MVKQQEFEAEWKKIQGQMKSGGFDIRKLVPKPDEDTEKGIYEGKVKMIVLLNSFPNRVLDWVSVIERKAFDAIRDSSGDGEFFKEGTYMCCKIDVQWRIAFLEKYYSSAGLSLAELTKIDSADKNAINELTDFLAAIGPSTRIPECALQKKVCELWLKRRIDQLGRASPQRFKDLIGKGGRLQWDSAGVFRFTQDAKGKTTVHHVDGNYIAVPSDFEWKPSHHLQDNHSDALASICMGSLTPIRIRTFFPKNTGPNTVSIVNRKSLITNTLAQEAKAEHDLSLQEGRSLKSRAEKIDEAVKDNEAKRKKEAMAKRAPKPPPDSKRRRTSLGAVIVGSAAKKGDSEDEKLPE